MRDQDTKKRKLRDRETGKEKRKRQEKRLYEKETAKEGDRCR